MPCKVCSRGFNEAREDLYKDALAVIRENDHFKKLPIVILERIVKTAYPDFVTISWERKTRCTCNVCTGWPPGESIEQSSSDTDNSYESGDDNDYCENDGYLYYTCRADICHKCFLEGIERVMRNSGSLPFLRFHSNAFFNRIPITIDAYKYIIPRQYRITYYRRKYPVNEDGKLFITSN